jgi:cytochrome P450
MAAIVKTEVSRWPVGRPFPLLPRMRSITFEVILRVVFGLDDPVRLDELRSSLRRLLEMGSSWMLVPALRRDLGRSSPWGRFVRLKAQVDALLRDEIRHRRNSDAVQADGVVSLLLDSMNDAELVDTLMTLLVAGHETTATSLAWCFELLLRRPDLVQRLRGELATGSTRLLDAVVRETLRVRPVFRYTSRRLRKPLVLGAYTLPAGVAVGANIYLAQHRGDHYDEPDVFKPERFLDSTPTSGTWVPFGGGIRRCLGASFATYEMGVVVRSVLEVAELRSASSRPERVKVHAITLVPGRSTRVVLEERSSVPSTG